MNWYALFVETGKEEFVREWLEFQFDKNCLTCFIPKRKLIEWKAGEKRTVLRNLFPGYVLIHTAMDYAIYYKIKFTPKVIRVLRGSSYFSVIPDSEIEVVKKLANDKGIIEFSTAFIEGSKISIIAGPLKGNEGLIQRIDKRKKRAKIKLTFSGSERLVDLGIELLEPVQRALGESESESSLP